MAFGSEVPFGTVLVHIASSNKTNTSTLKEFEMTKCLELFELNPDFTLKDLTNRLKEMIKKYHPDKHATKSKEEQEFYTRKTQDILECAEKLRDQYMSQNTGSANGADSHEINFQDFSDLRDLEYYIEYLKSLKHYQIVHHENFQSTGAKYQELARPLPEKLRKILSQKGFTNFYSHQAQAIDAARDGKNVLLLTPTASGKSLAYTVPILEEISKDSNATALFLFALKALSHDQVQKFEDFGIGTAKVYDGNTSTGEKKNIRRNPPNALFTNPDELHLSLLRTHSKWSRFLKNLKFIVLDDIHSYRGYFGSNVSNIIFRLKHILKQYGNTDFQIIATSATLGEPKEFIYDLTWISDFTIVKASGAGTPDRDLLMIESLDQSFEGALDFVVNQSLFLAVSGYQSIIFGHSRSQIELFAEYTRLRLTQILGMPSLKNDPVHKAFAKISIDDVIAYHAGYNDDERAEKEESIRNGSAKIICSTSALESGVDFPNLRICFLFGLSPAFYQNWQRIGRAGRDSTHDALSIIVNTGTAIDQYYFANPEAFVESSKQSLKPIIYPQNSDLLQYHLYCELHELMTAADSQHPEAFEKLDQDRFTKNGAYIRLNIRKPTDNFELCLPSGDKIMEVDRVRIYRDLYPGAIVRRGNQVYRLDNIDWAEKKLSLASKGTADKEYHTIPMIHADVQIKDEKSSTNRITKGPLQFSYGVHSAEITEYLEGFRESHLQIQSFTPRTYKKEMHHNIWGDVFWFTVSQKSLRGWKKILPDFGVGDAKLILHTIEHLMRHDLVRQGYCDTNDIQGITVETPVLFEGPTLFIYEMTPYNMGFPQLIYQHLPEILKRIAIRINRCPCKDGCPECIIARGYCFDRNEEVDKTQTAKILRFLADGEIEVQKTKKTKDTQSLSMSENSERMVKRGEYQKGDVYEENSRVGVVRLVGANEITVSFEDGTIKIFPYEDADV